MIRWLRRRAGRHLPSAEASKARAAVEQAAAEIDVELARQRIELARARPVERQLRQHNDANHFDRMVWEHVMKNAR